jgi:hypothetical protein
MSNLDENIFSCFCMNITKYKRTKIESWKAYKQGSRPDASEDEICPAHALHPYEGLLEGHSIYCNVFFFITSVSYVLTDWAYGIVEIYDIYWRANV